MRRAVELLGRDAVVGDTEKVMVVVVEWSGGGGGDAGGSSGTGERWLHALDRNIGK